LEKAHYNLNEIDVTFISLVIERLFYSVSQAEQNFSPQNEVFVETPVRPLLQKRVEFFTWKICYYHRSITKARICPWP